MSDGYLFPPTDLLSSGASSWNVFGGGGKQLWFSALLWAVGGRYGLHHMYLGNWKIVMLFLAFGLSSLYLVDMLLLPYWVAEANLRLKNLSPKTSTIRLLMQTVGSSFLAWAIVSSSETVRRHPDQTEILHEALWTWGFLWTFRNVKLSVVGTVKAFVAFAAASLAWHVVELSVMGYRTQAVSILDYGDPDNPPTHSLTFEAHSLIGVGQLIPIFIGALTISHLGDPSASTVETSKNRSGVSVFQCCCLSSTFFVIGFLCCLLVGLVLVHETSTFDISHDSEVKINVNYQTKFKLEDWINVEKWEMRFSDEMDEAKNLRILELPPDASWDEIKKQHRRLGLIWHPDKHHDEAAKAEAQAKFSKINVAYDNLRKIHQL